MSQKAKKEIMNQIQANLKDYQLEHPEVDFEQIAMRFGSPEMVAAAYVESAGTSEILKALRIRKRIVAIVASVMAVALFKWATAVTILFTQEDRAGAGFAIIELSELPQDTVVIDDSEVQSPTIVSSSRAKWRQTASWHLWRVGWSESCG